MPTIRPKTIAYLQYTSGSTSLPKAAIITHENLNASLKETAKAWRYDKKSVTLTWAPHTHVYGLICGWLVPLYHGSLSIIMPTALFIHRPIAWLRAITRYRVTHSGCPNFAYDLCVRDIADTELAEINLASWQVAINGGETVQHHTLIKFADKFRPCGFQLQFFNSAYGMSEATGAIAISQLKTSPPFFKLDAQALNHHQVVINQNANRIHVGNGKVLPGLTVKIVNPETLLPAKPHEVGEIWLAGKSIVSGYWQRPQENKQVFNQSLGSSKAIYFRTGDFGFLSHDELCLTGRLKEIMVIHGKKYYPADLENSLATVLQSFQLPNARMVFSFSLNDKEEIVCVEEINADIDERQQVEILEVIQQTILQQHNLQLYEVILVKKNSLPKTASGKLQRNVAKKQFLENQLAIIRGNKKDGQPTIDDQFIKLVSTVLNIDESLIDLHAPLSRYQFDSINIIKLTALLNDTYQLNLTPAALYEYKTLQAFLADKLMVLTYQLSSSTSKKQDVVTDKSNEIAIIGMSCYFPGAKNYDEFWENLLAKKNVISEVPQSRWQVNEESVKWGAFLDNVKQFDAPFFNLSPREAELTDPQQRLFLQTVWQTIEDAGYALEHLAEVKTGLFVGVFNHDYAELLQQAGIKEAYVTTGVTPSIIANRVSYLLNLQGPSEVIDTACSSSLVAIHHAVRAIEQGDCEMAIAGGVNALLTPTSFITATKAGMLCADGRCKTFDKNANGYVRGEGVAAILLKPLTHALRDGDVIHGVIKGTAINHGGHVNTLTAPNPKAQAEVIIAAHTRARMDIAAIDYIETHGTGTALGDPIEVNGLKKAFQQLANKQHKKLANASAGLSAVKTHIGHLESAAGIAGVIKILLALKHEIMPGNLNFSERNPYIELADSPFYIANETKPWRRTKKERAAGVSSFGFGGTNAHLVLAEAPVRKEVAKHTGQTYLIALSAKTDTALLQRKKDLHDWLARQQIKPALAALSFTLTQGRTHFEKRWVVAVKTLAELQEKLQADCDDASSLWPTKEFTWSHAEIPQRLALPAYPFDNPEYWLPQTVNKNAGTSFKKYLPGDAFYVRDHLINETPILPGVMFLQLVSAAFTKKSYGFRRIFWRAPLQIENAGKEITIHFREKDKEVAFDIFSGDDHLHAQGELIVDANQSMPPAINIDRLLNQPDWLVFTEIDDKKITYGPSFQVIKQLKYQDMESIAEVELPLHLAETAKEFTWHPSLLDGMLRTARPLLKNRALFYLPFSIEEIHLLQPLPARFYVHTKLVTGDATFNITAMNEQGEALLRIHHFSLRAKENEAGIYTYHPLWQAKPLAPKTIPDTSIVVCYPSDAIMQALKNHRVIAWASADFAQLFKKLETKSSFPNYFIYWCDPANANLLNEVITLSQMLLQHPSQPVTQLICVYEKNSARLHALVGFIKTLNVENKKITARLLQLTHSTQLLGELGELDVEVRYDLSGVRFVKQFAEHRRSQPFAIKKQGVYLLTGGLGGIGRIFADFLANEYQAQLVLMGRRTLEKDLKKMAGNPLYLKADVSQRQDVERVYATIKKRFGELNGIIHAAGITQDALIVKKSIKQLMQVVAPKIQGTINLDEVTKKEPLAFFALFSSVAAVFGNAGQSDYAYANHFMDCFAEEREALREKQHRFGKTVSINWPHWQAGGIVLTKTQQGFLEETLGITSLSNQDGIQLFLDALSQPYSQQIILPGHQAKLTQALFARTQVAHHAEQSAELDQALVDEAQNYFKQLLSQTVKLPVHQINSQTLFANYGIDSVMIIELNQKLAAIFGELPKTLFFEYQTLAELTQYFIKNQAHKLLPLLGKKQTLQTPSLTSPVLQTPSVNESQDKVDENQIHDDIAIIGMSGRYPGANDLAIFWENLRNGKDSISEIPNERPYLNLQFHPDKDRVGSSYSKWGGLIDGIDEFDPLFFAISPHEAELMDPQERLFLETAWKTIEDAGYPQEKLANQAVGVFVGVMYGQYQLWGAQEPFQPVNSFYAAIANRVSYFLNLHGPSIALDTMCSSSLTAIHLACQSIRQGECHLALAGGVNVHTHPNKYYLLSQGKFLASDGHCRSFGEGGDGYVPGEGVGAVLLKPLKQALIDGDLIYAVIKGSSINHGGKTNGFTVPNPKAQSEVIKKALQNARVSPEQISYVEAHGTGTSLGDPIEIAGLTNVFGNNPSCVLGSVKSNIGHLESAAGIAALTKVILQLQHQTMVPSLFSQTLNKNIHWENLPFHVAQEITEWQSPKIAAISSFGAGGANAHLVIAEAPHKEKIKSAPKPAYLFTLSAKTENALHECMQLLKAWLLKNPHASLEAISFTLNCGRSHFEKRFACVAKDQDELLAGLNEVTPLKNATSSTVFKKIIRQLMQELSQVTSTDEYCETLSALAQFYRDGYDLDWALLHQHESQQKIALPTYPFAKERYFIGNSSFIETSAQESGETLLDKVQQQLMQWVATILKIEPRVIKKDKQLSDYGMDSVHFIALVKAVNDYYQLSITPALVYMHNHIQAISEYLVKNHAETLAKKHEATLPIILEQRVSKTLHSTQEAIAIIGMSGLFPQSANLNLFWQHLLAGDDLVTEIPKKRWDFTAHYGDTKTHADKSHSKWGGFLDAVDLFDAGFFNISSTEANFMDPQQRLFLEVAWATFEDAGYNPLAFSQEKVGVFAGVEFSEYQTLIAEEKKSFHGYIATGNSHSLIPNRVSYFLNLRGPSEAIDTACSSSLVAIHRAVTALQRGECSLALAGGVSLILNPDTLIITSQLGALSREGRCKTFDKTANGYVKGEGVAAILLKPLAAAQKEGDAIYGIIKGTGVNHGGKAQSLTAPNAKAQSELLTEVYEDANIDPESISYIETHGTGTELGDPVEIEALKLAFKNTEKKAFCGLGSLKTNIGHLEPASGIASVIKVLLALKHRVIPKNLHFHELNPYIHIANSPFYLINENKSWESSEPLRAGVSSFGFGGTNAHLIMEEAPSVPSSSLDKKPAYLLTLSAKQEQSLRQKIVDLHTWLVRHQDEIDLASLSFTLNTGRTHFDYRLALIVDSMENLLSTLAKLIQDEPAHETLTGKCSSQSANGPLLDQIYQTTLQGIKTETNQATYYQHLRVLADLYIKNYPLDWSLIHANENHRRIASLPTYPFMKQSYWFDRETMTSLINQPIVSLETQLLNYLKTIFAEQLKISAEQIAIDETYEVYGVDSLQGLKITERLEKDFGSLPKTLLYERNQLKELARFLQKHHAEKLKKLFQLEAMTPLDSSPVVANITSVRDDEPIAIIGLSGVFPMANDMHEFWQNLIAGRDCITEIPQERWNYKDYPIIVGDQEKYYRHGGFIPDVDQFDPLFFNISPRDATLMDPQERLFLQSAWTTIEDAGYTREKLKRCASNQVGVFAGVTYNYYPLFIAEEWQQNNRVPLDIQLFSVANRVSYFFNFNGPSYVVDTACSSSLAAIHLACESIRRGECQMALAGGVNLSLHPSKYHFLASFMLLSDEGRCATFAEGGTGYVPGEGVGSVLLKPLGQAVQEGDRIYGVIKSSSMNHGGKTSGYTVPNPNAQSELIKNALTKANINPISISYVEAHGTGTALGDPIEIRGLQDAFETFTDKKQFCAIGSVKSNIGHLESAAGISQLAKVLLQMRYQKLVPSIHAQKLNPYINFADTAFYVQRELSDWHKNANEPRRASMSSFGAGGTNVHLIVDEYIATPKEQEKGVPSAFIFVLSAVDKERLKEYVKRTVTFLQREQNKNQIALKNICYTSQLGREAMASRLAWVVSSYDDLLQQLSQYLTQSYFSAPTHELAQRWLQGEKVEWEKLYEGANAQFVDFPTYPFAKRRCWVQAPKKASESLPEVSLTDWLYTTQWEKKPLTNQPVEMQTEHWLIVGDKTWGEWLQTALPNATCYFAMNGEEFVKNREHEFTINPEEASHYAQIIAEIFAKNAAQLTGVIYVPPLNSSCTHHHLLYLLQALLQKNWPQSLKFCLVSRDALWHGPLWATLRIFATEQVRYQVLLIEIDEKASSKEAETVVREIQLYKKTENHIAYHHQERSVLRFNQLKVSLKTNWQAPKAALITGGAGALGLEVAKWLISEGTEFLLLIGRSQKSLAQIQSQLNPPKKTAEIIYHAADVADKGMMQQIISDAEEKWHQAIDGVFHLAGISTDNLPIANIDKKTWDEVLAVKIKGALVLHELFASQKLTCFVLFSSIAAIPYFGVAGLSAYATANEFLNRLALWRRQQGLPATSINWVAWAEKGMSHEYDHSAFLDAVGMSALSIADGIALLKALLMLPDDNVTVCKIDWAKFFSINGEAQNLDFFAHFAKEFASVNKKTALTLSAENISEIVLTTFAKILNLQKEEMDLQIPFEQYGVDSISGIQFTTALTPHFGEHISAMDLYRYPTLAQLIAYLTSCSEETKKTPSTDEDENLVKKIASLSETEINHLLEAELADL